MMGQMMRQLVVIISLLILYTINYIYIYIYFFLWGGGGCSFIYLVAAIYNIIDTVLSITLTRAHDKYTTQNTQIREKIMYSQTCIKWHRIKRSPSIKRSVVKVPKIMSLDYCNFDLY